MTSTTSENALATSVSFKQKFPASRVKEIIKEVVEKKLAGESYSPDMCPIWTKEIADDVKNSVKDLDLSRYKVIVQALVGEKRGQCVRFATRSFWDNSTDSSASYSFNNENLYASVTVYGVWFY